jgi:hypothetical protein
MHVINFSLYRKDVLVSGLYDIHQNLFLIDRLKSIPLK